MHTYATKDKRMPIIYIIEHTKSTSSYVGKVEKPNHTEVDRFREHVKSSKRPKTHLHRALAKYGPDEFVVRVIERVSDGVDVNDRERHWIKELNPSLNMTGGGDGGSTTHNRKWFNNGITNMYILDGAVIPDGFVRGRICLFNDPEFQRQQSRKVDRQKAGASIKRAWAEGKMQHRKPNPRFGDDNPAKRPEVRAKLSASARARAEKKRQTQS